MVWDDAVTAYAQSYAHQRIGDYNLVHSGGPYGENLTKPSESRPNLLILLCNWLPSEGDQSLTQAFS
ncbi:hypothetical protein Taro_020907 [Colocasia esculenta]|uniref:Uncharacterized protein n=1 Tax=Colocasia esculenta TaxID=4460 RepID=A0A843UPW5_COLES|nr:hypothetical protein [Colocasia esculenta]